MFELAVTAFLSTVLVLTCAGVGILLYHLPEILRCVRRNR